MPALEEYILTSINQGHFLPQFYLTEPEQTVCLKLHFYSQQTFSLMGLDQSHQIPLGKDWEKSKVLFKLDELLDSMSCCVLSNWAILPTPVYKIKTIHNDLGSTMKTLKPKKNKNKKHATDYLFT